MLTQEIKVIEQVPWTFERGNRITAGTNIVEGFKLATLMGKAVSD